MADEVMGVLGIEVAKGRWNIHHLEDGKPQGEPLAVLIRDDEGFAVHHPDRPDRLRRLKAPDLGEALKLVEEAVAKTMSKPNRATAGYFRTALANMNVLASQLSAMNAFVDALAVAFADTLYEDVKQAARAEVIQAFADQVADRLKERSAKAELGAIVGQLLDAIAAAAKEDDDGGDEPAMKH